MSNYVTYHLHSDFSLLDSCTNYKLYVDKAHELGQSAICFTEHGNIYSWVEKKIYAESQGLKYLHGIEVYLTEQLEPKVRDNYHTILIAKDYDGVQEINELVDLSTQDDHFYYKPRITFDEFKAISSHVIKISACLASPLNAFRKSDMLEDLIDYYDYLEIQPHIFSDDQKEYNEWLWTVSKQTGIPLIAGTDTHALNGYKLQCRSILQKAKGIEFTNEDEFDLSYKSYDELCQMFKKQDVLPEDVYLEAIENTNVMADSVEAFELDTSFKYPVIENAKEKLWQRCNDRYYNKVWDGMIEDNAEYLKRAQDEIEVFEKVDMCGFMVIMSDIMTWCRENGIPSSPCRGSVGGSVVAYLCDIINVDPLKWGTVFSRFCNEHRMEIGDIDVDISPDQRDLVYQHIIDTFGDRNCAYILANGTISDKGTIDDVGRALKYPLKEVAEIKDLYDKDQDAARMRYPDLFYWFDGLVGTVVSQSMHPAGIIASPVDLTKGYGTFWNKGKKILCINMEEVHEISLVKYDILGLQNVQIIRECCEMAHVPFPMAEDLNWDDQAVYEDMIKSPVGLFQFESSFAFDSLKKFKPHSIGDISLVTAAIRPSGESFRNRLLSHEINHNPSKQIDDLLARNNGFLVYQEDVIAFLQQICGLSGGDADNVRRAIGRKQADRLEAALPAIFDGYCAKSDKPREEAEEEARTFLKIIEDSSSYMFGYNHATGYSMVTYLCAYMRYYHPLEFISAYLNSAKTDEDIANGVKLAGDYGIKIFPIRWGKSRAEYFFDPDSRAIYEGCGAVKWMNDQVANDLYALSQSRNFESFTDLLYAMKDIAIDSRQLQILIELDYFSDFGNAVELWCISGIFDILKNGDAKKISKDRVEPGTDWYDAVSHNAVGTNRDGSEAKFWTITDCYKLMRDMEANVFARHMEDYSISVKVKAQIEYLGHISITGRDADRKFLVVRNVYPLKRKSDGHQFGVNVLTTSLGSGKQSNFTVFTKVYSKFGAIHKGDIIKCLDWERDGKYFRMTKYEQCS